MFTVEARERERDREREVIFSTESLRRKKNKFEVSTSQTLTWRTSLTRRQRDVVRRQTDDNDEEEVKR